MFNEELQVSEIDSGPDFWIFMERAEYDLLANYEKKARLMLTREKYVV